MDEVDHQIDQLFDLFNQFVAVEDSNKKWRTFRKVFMSLGVKIQFDFSEDAKDFNIPFKDGINEWAKRFGLGEDVLKIPKLNEVLPMVFARVLEFDPFI